MSCYQYLQNSGTEDFVCNYIGGREWTLAMEWPGQNGFNSASENPWNVQGKPAGLSRSFDSFTFLQVYNAGRK